MTKAEWIDVEKELPKLEGIYFVLTDDFLIRGIGIYGALSDDDKVKTFEVLWATSGPGDGSEPHVKYWLKDHHWGMVYDYKKKKGEI